MFFLSIHIYTGLLCKTVLNTHMNLNACPEEVLSTCTHPSTHTSLRVLCLSSPGHAVIPKYYHVPADFVEAEQNKHGSQKRFPSNSGRDGKMFLWGQALYNIAKLLGMPLHVFVSALWCSEPMHSFCSV